MVSQYPEEIKADATWYLQVVSAMQALGATEVFSFVPLLLLLEKCTPPTSLSIPNFLKSLSLILFSANQTSMGINQKHQKCDLFSVVFPHRSFALPSRSGRGHVGYSSIHYPCFLLPFPLSYSYTEMIELLSECRLINVVFFEEIVSKFAAVGNLEMASNLINKMTSYNILPDKYPLLLTPSLLALYFLCSHHCYHL